MINGNDDDAQLLKPIVIIVQVGRISLIPKHLCTNRKDLRDQLKVKNNAYSSMNNFTDDGTNFGHKKFGMPRVGDYPIPTLPIEKLKH